MTSPDYLACTKAPPRDVPPEARRGLGLCVAPRNHDGPCEYSVEGGGRAVLFKMDKSPVEMVEDIKFYHRKARRAYKVSMYCSIVSAMTAGWLLMDVIRSMAGG